MRLMLKSELNWPSTKVRPGLTFDLHHLVDLYDVLVRDGEEGRVAHRDDELVNVFDQLVVLSLRDHNLADIMRVQECVVVVTTG